MLSPIILQFLPLVLLGFYSLYLGRRNNVHSIPFAISLVFIAVIVIALAYYPEELNHDKPRYTIMYLYSLSDQHVDVDYKDIGWPYYVFFCGRLFGRNIDLYYLFTALLYVSGYCFFANKFFKKDNIGYFLVFAVGCLGFVSYGVNTIRAGIALSLLLYSITLYKSKKKIGRIVSLIIAVIAVLIHKSMVIPFSAFVVSAYMKNLKIAFYLWGVCLFLSAANFDLSTLYEVLGFVDERVDTYIEEMGVVSSYRSGFRIDFVIYSIIPLLFAFFYIIKKRINDDFFLHITRMYLLSNAIWLLAIRVHYTDRLAYLSWFLIPILLILPVCNNQKYFKSPQNMILLAMFVFMSLPLFLMLKEQ